MSDSTAGAASTAVLVVGMHRTGTSALARIFALHGVDLGADVTPPDEHNPRGYWENRTIVKMHDALLAALGTCWSDLAPLPVGWRESAPARAFVDDLRQLLPAMFDAGRPLLVKDPRLALLVPLWIEALPALRRRPVFVLTIRHPDEVAASLGRRDRLSLAWSRQLWLRHVVEAERATRGSPRVFVHYERLLADWGREWVRITRCLGIGLGGGEDVARSVGNFLDPTLRHHRHGASEDLPAPLRDVYAQACAAAEGATLDAGLDGPALSAWEALGVPIITELSSRLAEERARLAELVVALEPPGRGGADGRVLWTDDATLRRAQLRFGVDEPREGATIEGPVRVCGWCFGAGGLNLPVCVRVGDSIVAATSGHYRPDVAAAFPDHLGVTHSGFDAHLDLAPGRRELTVEAWLGFGSWVPLATRHVDVGRARRRERQMGDDNVGDGALTICTIISKNYLAQARVLAESLACHDPGARLWVLLTDEVDGKFDPDAQPFTLVPIASLDIPDLPRLCFKYSTLELNTAVKPYFLAHLFARGAQKVVYLDPDVMVYRSLQPLAELLDRHAIVLTPHLTEPYTDSAHPSEVDILRAGAYNLGFLALADRPSAMLLLEWWKKRLYAGCRVDPDRGLFVDQKWMDLAPGLFDGVYILRDSGYNVGYWNLHSRTVTVGEGGVKVNGGPCHFFHFSGYDPGVADQVSLHQGRFAMKDIGDARELFASYGQRLLDMGQRESSRWPYSWATFDNGEPISPAERLAYLELGERAAGFGDPFAVAGEGSFYSHHRASAVASPTPCAGPLKLPFGVNVAGFFRSEKGVGEGSRAIARALDAAGVPYVLNNIVDGGSANLDRGDRPFTDENPYAINLVHINADSVIRFCATRGPEYFRGRRNIGYWNWELDRFPPAWKDSFAPFDEIWTPSTFSQRSIAEASPIPVRCIPYALAVPTDAPDHTRATLGLPEDAFLFAFAFDFHSVVERKNPLGAIRAFQRAFGHDDRVGLVVKTVHASDEPRAWRELESACSGWSNIHLIDRVLDRAAMHALVQLCDTFVSLHRAEGFGFLMAEAMAMGKPTVATAYSSNLDYMTTENSLLVRYRILVIDRDQGPYRRGATWADPDVDHAADLMRGVERDRQRARQLGERARADMARGHSPARIGSLIRSRLAELAELAELSAQSIQSRRPAPLDALLADLRMSADLMAAESSSSRPVVGRAVERLRDVAMRLLRPALARQSVHNEVTNKVLAALAEQLENDR